MQIRVLDGFQCIQNYFFGHVSHFGHEASFSFSFGVPAARLNSPKSSFSNLYKDVCTTMETREKGSIANRTLTSDPCFRKLCAALIATKHLKGGERHAHLRQSSSLRHHHRGASNQAPARAGRRTDSE